MSDENGTEPQAVVPSVLVQKADDAQVLEAQRRSVEQQNPNPNQFGDTVGHDDTLGPLMFAMASAGDGIVPWGTSVTARDRQLRAYVPTESVLAGAVGSVIARNEAMPWSVTSDEADIPLRDACVDVLQAADRGAGWMSLIGKVSFDLYAADKGAFVEFIRAQDSPESPVIGLNHLDSTRCFSTGRDDFPVMYRDVRSRWHRLAWYQVWHLLEEPTPHETLYGLQQCAVTRVMRISQVWRNITTYMDEKTGGRHTRGISFVNGVTQQALKQALAEANALADSELRERYAMHPIVLSLQPDVAINVQQLDFASIPDGFDAEEWFKQYLTTLALGFLVDFQEFAPLPGGNLGTSSQSEILNAKARAKSPQVFRKLIEDMINRGGVCPEGVEFKFTIDDPETDKLLAEGAKIRAEERKLRVEATEIDGQGARQLALDEGDLSEEQFDEISDRDDLTSEASTSGSARPLDDTDNVDKAVSPKRRAAETASADIIADPVLTDLEASIRERLEIGERT
ncbi:MAG: hypothetical protein V3R71_08110 [Gemmatimonadales bacterium]